MNSYPRIESFSSFPEEGLEEEISYPAIEDEGDSQQVDGLRVAQLSRGQARCEGALSETPRRGRQLIGDRS